MIALDPGFSSPDRAFAEFAFSRCQRMVCKHVLQAFC